jgi:hypothetical protein
VSARPDQGQALGAVLATREIKEAGRLLSAAGFTELPGIRADAKVGFRTIGEYYELVILFADGHLEAIRQIVDSPLWLPGRDEPGDFEWMKSGEPLEVVHELLALPS